MKPLQALLLVVAGAIAVLGGAYLTGALGPTPDERSAALAPTPTAPAATGPAAVPAPGAGEPAAPGAEPSPAPATGVTAPSFDIVRVEGDGSILIAGKAAPNASIEIVEGSDVIGTAKAGPEGDFAAVLDEPLKAGSHEIVLRATAPDSVVTTSPETAIVSIPETADGQVLALVEQPGQPSRLITVPEPPSPAAAAPAAPSPVTAPAQPTGPAEPQATANAPSREPAAPPAAAAPADAPAAATPPAGEAPKPEPGMQVATTPPPSAPEPQAPAPTVPAAEPAAPAPSAPAAKPEPKPAIYPTIAVEAVEIEGRDIFVAGRAEPGRIVRAYANDILLGDARTSPTGRFLIDTVRDLPVGDYIVRADMLAPDGVGVLARAAVPFTREEGEFVAAVAPEQPAAPAPSGAAPATAPAQAPQVSTVPPAPRLTPAPAPQAATTTQAATTPQTSPTAPASPAPEQPTSTPPQAQTPTPAAPAAIPEAESRVAAAPAAPEAQAEPATSLSPRLESVKSAVIIRRGDSLWRISRRVYGRGVRFSTIYLANQDQIEDPNRIWPGQIFAVPDKTGEGEAADMSKIGEQATTRQ